MPFDVAFNLSEEDMMAWSIIIGQQQGGKWSWGSMSWITDD